MRRELVLFVALFMTSTAFTIAQTEKTGNELFVQAQRKVYEDQDFDGAIGIYNQILKEFASDRSLAGRVSAERVRAKEFAARAEARRAYEKVARDYPDQPAVIERAGRLSEAAAQERRHGVYIAAFDAPSGAVSGPVSRLTEWETSERYPSFSPDGRFVALKRGPTEESLNTGGRNAGGGVRSCACAAVIRSLDTAVEVVYAPTVGTEAVLIEADADWLPGDAGILTIQGSTLNRLDRQGGVTNLGNLPSVFSTRENPQPTTFTSRTTALSPDGKRIYLYVVQASGANLQEVTRNNLTTSSIVTVDLASKQPPRGFQLPTIATTAVFGPRSYGRSIAVNPAGDTLALIRRPWGPEAHIVLSKPDGEEYRVLFVPTPTSLQINHVTWIDSASLLFSEKAPNDPLWRIMRVPATGGEPVFTGLQVADLGNLDVSSDGTRIVFDGTGYSLSAPGDSERRK